MNLPFMVAAVLVLLWRDVAGVTELPSMLAREGFLWCSPLNVSQPAISQRFLTFPAQLFEPVFKDLLPNLRAAWYDLGDAVADELAFPCDQISLEMIPCPPAPPLPTPPAPPLPR